MIRSIDHIVLTSSNIDKTVHFYCSVLVWNWPFYFRWWQSGTAGFMFWGTKNKPSSRRISIYPACSQSVSGAVDICFLSDIPVDEWAERLTGQEIAIEDGPVQKWVQQARSHQFMSEIRMAIWLKFQISISETTWHSVDRDIKSKKIKDWKGYDMLNWLFLNARGWYLAGFKRVALCHQTALEQMPRLTRLLADPDYGSSVMIVPARNGRQ